MVQKSYWRYKKIDLQIEEGRNRKFWKNISRMRKTVENDRYMLKDLSFYLQNHFLIKNIYIFYDY